MPISVGMERTPPPDPTERELQILRILWERGPSTVRQVQETMNRSQATGYTTVLKLMQIISGSRFRHPAICGRGAVLVTGPADVHVYWPMV